MLTVLMIIGCTTRENIEVQEPNLKNNLEYTYLEHIDSIRANLESIYPNSKDSTFIDNIINNKLKSKEDIKYISYRKLLRKFNYAYCWKNVALLRDTLNNGKTCEIVISVKPFNIDEHKLEKHKTIDYYYEYIDGQELYGGNSSALELEIEEISIKVDKKELNIPKKVYNNLINPNLCYFGGYTRKVEAYVSKDNIYLYIYGGNASDNFFAKIIFNSEGYISSIIANYNDLSNYGSYKNEFVGF